MAMKRCPNCGERISEETKFCIYCGANIKEVEKTLREKANATSRAATKPAATKTTTTKAATSAPKAAAPTTSEIRKLTGPVPSEGARSADTLPPRYAPTHIKPA